MTAWRVVKLGHMMENKSVLSVLRNGLTRYEDNTLIQGAESRTRALRLHTTCVWCYVCVRKRMCQNQYNTMECCSVGGHTLSSQLPSSPSEQPQQDIKRNGQRKKGVGWHRDKIRNEIPDRRKKKIKSTRAGKKQEEEKIKNGFYTAKKWEVWQILKSRSGTLTENGETLWAQLHGLGEEVKETKWGNKNSLSGDR